MTLPPDILPPAHVPVPVRNKAQLPVRYPTVEERQIAVFIVDEAGHPLAAREGATAPPGHHPYPGMPGLKGMIRPGILLDIVI